MYSYVPAMSQVEAMQKRAVMPQQQAVAHPGVAMSQRPWKTSWQVQARGW